MQETIQQSGSQGGITGEDARPILESDVGGDDDRAALVAFGDDLKEQLSALVQGQVPLIHRSAIFLGSGDCDRVHPATMVLEGYALSGRSPSSQTRGVLSS